MNRRGFLGVCGVGCGIGTAGCLFSVDQDEDEYDGDPWENPASNLGVGVTIEVVESAPDGVEPVPSDDERIEDVELINDALDLIFESDSESEEELYGEAAMEHTFPRTGEKAQEAREAREQLPDHVSDPDKAKETYIEHKSYTLRMNISRVTEGPS
ncbi:hypothetical protein [Natranaeroarchaeum sulfidigenes]|uniref:hypothetical protein n=1 Tax=Natranaeroarchaeum sulfidigenes TaxID=2784880 RepID=UPI001EE6128A|nr:hypothetical protein [Natranaeroarchaeum sulfidigenes]